MPIHDWTHIDAGTFHFFHQLWISSLCNALNAGVLPKGCFAMSEQIIGGPIPDVIALQTTSKGKKKPEPTDRGVAVATPPRTRIMQKAEPERYAARADRVIIRHVRGSVIAVIEIVSPGNKSGRHAIRAIVDKSVDLIRQGIHLLVIDLFPPGPRDPQGIHQLIWEEIDSEPFALPPDKPLTLAAYSAGSVIKAFVEPVAVGDTLPDMALFLTEVLHVPTPLEATYQTTWNVFPVELKELLETPADSSPS